MHENNKRCLSESKQGIMRLEKCPQKLRKKCLTAICNISSPIGRQFLHRWRGNSKWQRCNCTDKYSGYHGQNMWEMRKFWVEYEISKKLPLRTKKMADILRKGGIGNSTLADHTEGKEKKRNAAE